MMLKKIIVFLTFLLPIIAVAQKATPNDYIQMYAPSAKQEMMRSGVPAAITLAQGILESESGNSELAQKSNNHFGIKCKSNWEGAKVYHNDDARGECFRKYETVEESYKDHSDFLKANARYAFLFNLNPDDYKGWAKGLKQAGYATNPVYAQKLIDLIEKYNLQQFNHVEYIENNTNNIAVQVPTTNQNNATSTTEKQPTILLVDGAIPGKVIYINETKAVYVEAGTSLLSIAQKNDMELSKLLDFNDMDEKANDILETNQIIYLKRKRKQSVIDMHIVKEQETLHSIAQLEGIRLESLLKTNNLQKDQKPKVGTILYLNNKNNTNTKK
jgi:LysM repeat protein